MPDPDEADQPEEPVKDNKMPWWHKYWYGKNLPVKEEPEKGQHEEE